MRRVNLSYVYSENYYNKKHQNRFIKNTSKFFLTPTILHVSVSYTHTVSINHVYLSLLYYYITWSIHQQNDIKT